jgi:hypothetical protein
MSFDSYPVETKPRLLTVSSSIRSLPQILLSGAWLGHWGFNFGDRLSAYFVGCGHLLIKALPVMESTDDPDNRQQAPPQIATLPILKNRRPHPMSVFPSYRWLPQVTITGAWLRDWGISKGDRICVTLEAENVISIKLTMSAAEWRKAQLAKELEQERKQEEADALSTLKKYKDKYPALFEQVANLQKKRIATRKPTKSTHLYQLDLIMPPAIEYSPGIAAFSANLSAAS